MTTIRDAEPGDAEAVARVLAAADDARVLGAAAWLHMTAVAPARGRELRLVAEAGGEVVATAGAGLEWSTADARESFAFVAVLPAARGRGIGSALHERALEHVRGLGARRARTKLRESSAGVAFASARGWRELRAESVVGVDPRDVPEHPGIAGFRAVSLASLADRLEDVYALDLLATEDEPTSVPLDAMSFEEWLAVQWRNPASDNDGGTAVVEDERLVALAFLRADLERGRAENGFTATHPDYRGRGLATLAKTRSLLWAAEHGIERVTTGNDETNAPMRAVNHRLGYEPVARRLELELPL
ncbi:MAG TPA: GNAT family N-acetyltransferase [Gaiellaceae bacterium]|nr:GNAT family N-acetyltransferase [Gaiellaceae bacterium]